jgi:hypothetical protein
MSNVVDFTARRQAKVSPPPKIPTIFEINVEQVDALIGDWEKMVRANRLNDYFKTALPNVIGFDSTVNYMADLNEIARVEIKLGIGPVVFFPGNSEKNKLGWICEYKIGNDFIATPELMSECYARTFGILLYLKVKRAALQSGAI